MKFSQIKTTVEFCNDLFSTPDWREVVENLVEGCDDFEVDNVRFIKASGIDAVLASELSSDTHVLGCFNASFIAEVTGWPMALIEAAQKGDAYDALGQAIVSEGYAESMAEAYASADGYGHHFNHYDGNEEEVTLNGTSYHVFDNH